MHTFSWRREEGIAVEMEELRAAMADAHGHWGKKKGKEGEGGLTGRARAQEGER